MTSNEKIVMFMEGKNNLIKSYNKKLIYFKVGDKKEILSWSKNDANKIWKIIKKNKNEIGLTILTCPFCLKNIDTYDEDTLDGTVECSNCGYGKRHGKCSKESSTFDKIASFFVQISNTSDTINIDEIFSKKFNNELIKSIEKEGV